MRLIPVYSALIVVRLLVVGALAQDAGRDPRVPNVQDARNQRVAVPEPVPDPELMQYGIYERTAATAVETEPRTTMLPLELPVGARIGLIGNTLFDRGRHFGHLETLIHQRFPEHQLVFRNLSWSADTITLQPRPENFANVIQHLTHERVDVIIAAFGFNESFAGEAGLEEFRKELTASIRALKSKAFNGQTAPQVVLVSPISAENIASVRAAELNNTRIQLYLDVMQDVAAGEQVGFVDVFTPMSPFMESLGSDLTINGVHLNEAGYAQFADVLYTGLFSSPAPQINDAIRQLVIDQDRQYFRRYRPLNTFYYTGGRSKDFGYLDFLPAMRNFDLLTAHRDQLIWEVAAEGEVQDAASRLAEAQAKLNILDATLPPLPATAQSRGANEWLSPVDEYREFEIDPRFAVNLFADETMFPELACPIQMRWDGLGRLWVSCSTTYPHVYPGQEPNDKLVILEDVDGNGRADKSTVFADDLHIPLSFEFGDGGVYVSEMPDLTFLKDTDGDGKADLRQRVLTGFGTEDSHHALHDFTWTPDGDLIWRESIFHHTQVETPYGPVRQQNSGWFRFQPRTQQLISFGSYPSTNPWGVNFDHWGQHMASHPVYAAAFHALDPPYPAQHAAPKGLQAYSGTCGQEFIDFNTFPDELLPQPDGTTHFIKVRYKPTNRVEIHKWIEGDYGYTEEYVGDLLFSRNLSFIPVDLQFGPRGDLYLCDWYNPVKGHAQYSLRDERRDRHSGRIWRIVAQGKPLQEPPRITAAAVPELVQLLQRPESRVRYWAKRELRERNPEEVIAALDAWVATLDARDTSYRHHQIEAIWAYRWLGAADHLPVPVSAPVRRPQFASPVAVRLLRDLLACEDRRARAAATQQLRYWWPQLDDTSTLLRNAANDSHGIVRMEAVIAATYIGDHSALEAVLETLKYPRAGHLDYAIQCALESQLLRRHWEGAGNTRITALLAAAREKLEIKEPVASAADAEFDRQLDLKLVRVSCVPERMKYTVEQFFVTPGQPVKVVFENPDATDHNLVFVQPGQLEAVGMAANEMAKDRRNANSDFIPESQRSQVLVATPMIGATRKSMIHVLRFNAPSEPGIYPYVCTFPGHWIIMQGAMVVANDQQAAEALVAASRPSVGNQWKIADFTEISLPNDDATRLRGAAAFTKARCHQCHQIAGQGVNLGPDLTKIGEKFRGLQLLRQILEPSVEVHKQYQMWQLITTNGQVLTGYIKSEDEERIQLIANLLTPDVVLELPQREVEVRRPVAVSPMPAGLLNVLSRDEVVELVNWLQWGGVNPSSR